MGRVGLLATFIVAIGLLTWDEIKRLQRVPHPETYMHAVIVWVILGIIAELGVPELAALFGVGIILSMLYVYLQGPDQSRAGETIGEIVGEGAGAVTS